MSESIRALMNQFLNEWLLIRVEKTDEADKPIKGELIFHSKNRDEVYEKQRGMKVDLYLIYSGEIPQKGYAVAFQCLK